MDFTGRKVVHKVWGEGVVESHSHPYVKVQFANESKILLFPDAFRDAMVFANSDDQHELRQMIADHEWGKLKEAAAWTAKAPDKSAPVQRRTTSSTPKAPRPVERPNIVFKCNYCDGGTNERHIGYMGPCSDKLIRYNIDEAHHSWCSDVDCPCRRYLEGDIDVFELEQMFLNGDMVCYESKMLIDWTAFAGTILKGDKKDEPKKIRNTRLNSLAVLTTRKPHTTEEDRFVFGVFLVDDADEGDSREAGFVKCTSEYRIELAPDEATQIKFWNYHANDTKPERAVWGQGLYRYTNDIEAVQILRDIAKIKKSASEKKFAEDFLAHFCKMKSIDINEVPEPNGALKR